MDGKITCEEWLNFANFEVWYNNIKSTDDFCKMPIGEIIESDITDFIKMNIKRYNLTRKTYASMRTLIIGVFKYAKSRHLTQISISTYFADLQISRNLFKKNKKSAETQVFKGN